MTGLSDAIMALGPAIYYRLQETSGTTITDSSGNAHHGTISGDYQLAVSGPVIGSTGIRFYSTGTVISPPLAWTGWQDFSIVYLATHPAAGGESQWQNVIGIGDYLNPTTRGIRLEENSGSSQQLQGRYDTSNGGNQLGAVWPQNYWKVWAFTYKSTTTQLATFWVGVGTPTTGGSLGAPVQVTDRLWVKPTTPVVVSELALFTRTLAQTEVTNLSNYVQAWPYEIGSNQIPAQGGGTVDLTPVTDDTAQILANQTTMEAQLQATKQNTEDIKGFWNGYQTVTLPDLQQVLSNIQTTANEVITQIATSVTDAVGAVPTTIGQLLSAALPDAPLSRQITDDVTCDPINFSCGGQPIYSVTVTINAYPADWKWSTPDNAYSVRDLAVIRFYVGEVLVGRHGIHTISHQIQPLPASNYPLVWGGVFRNLPDPYTITVDWAPGVCGQLHAADFFG